MRRKDSLCALACGFCVSRKGGTGGGRWGHPQGDMHMVAARLGYQSAMVGDRVGLLILRLEVELGPVLESELGQK